MGERAAPTDDLNWPPIRWLTPTSWNCACLPTKQYRQAVAVARLDNLGKGASSCRAKPN